MDIYNFFRGIIIQKMGAKDFFFGVLTSLFSLYGSNNKFENFENR